MQLYEAERALMIQSHAGTVCQAAETHENAVRELRSQHIAELENVRLRVAAAVERAKEAALHDATACFESERDRMARLYASAVQQAATVHEDVVQLLQARHAAELESERLRPAETRERLEQAALDEATAQVGSELVLSRRWQQPMRTELRSCNRNTPLR